MSTKNSARKLKKKNQNYNINNHLQKSTSMLQRNDFHGRVSCPSLPVMSMEGKLTLPSISKAKPSAMEHFNQQEFRNMQMMQDEYQLDYRNQHIFTEEVSLNNSALYKMPEVYSKIAHV